MEISLAVFGDESVGSLAGDLGRQWLNENQGGCIAAPRLSLDGRDVPESLRKQLAKDACRLEGPAALADPRSRGAITEKAKLRFDSVLANQRRERIHAWRQRLANPHFARSWLECKLPVPWALRCPTTGEVKTGRPGGA